MCRIVVAVKGPTSSDKPCSHIESTHSVFFCFCRKQLETPVQGMRMGTRGEGAWSQEEGGGEEEGVSLLDQRSSVFDRDEFDVFRRKADVDLSRVHIGKR